MRLLNGDSVQAKSSATQLKEIVYSEMIPGSASKTITLPAFQQFDLRTIYAKSGTTDPISIQIIDGITTKNVIYQSNKDTFIYDIINIPINDKDQTSSIHFVVTNNGVASNQVYIKFQITSF